MNRTIMSYLNTLAGLVLLAGGLYFIRTIDDPQGMMRVLPYILVGLGCSIFGHGIGGMVNQYAMTNAPAAAKQLEIDRKDERNVAIANRAKAKAYDMMVFVFGALIIAISLMGIDLMVLLLLIFVYVLIVGSNSYYRFKYYKEM